ncbi:hypothetical protein [Rhodophyticola sp. CCM32]|uniref:hypothetical protein n=1 Tax=Rhodophyticola sp. CCM32 TaxID=2916397 RepID=UPI00143D9C64|nr:hypothetical protein [Rhodophyticola sp. CCM32]
MTRALQALLALTRHVTAPPTGLCRACPEDDLRQELSSLSRAADIARIASATDER